MNKHFYHCNDLLHQRSSTIIIEAARCLPPDVATLYPLIFSCFIQPGSYSKSWILTSLSPFMPSFKTFSLPQGRRAPQFKDR